MSQAERSILREGVVAGLVGAATVALWFFVLDFARGKPLITPALLGSAVFHGINNPIGLQPALAPILGYTLLHGVAFIAFGVVGASLIALNEQEPPVFVVFVLLFVAFEVSFVGLLTAFSRSLLGALVWWAVLVANFLASVAMLGYLFRHHQAYGGRSPLAPIWFASTVGIAAGLAIAGIVMHGWSAISWTSAVVWGIVAAAAFLVVGLPLSVVAGDLDFLDLLGSVFAPPGTTQSRVIGAVIHLVDGALLGVAWAYGTVLFDWPLWGSGLVWGLILWVLALTMINTIGSVHPAIRRGELPDPGGSSIPALAMLLPHIVYGIVLDGLYHRWPI